jgi:pilus assembly protein CpaB
MQIQDLQKKLPLIIAIACGILAIALLNIYLKQRESEIFEKIKQIPQQARPAQPQQQIAIALVAQTDIPAQVPITPGDVAIKEIPAEYLQPGAVTSLEEVIGQITAVEIAAGEQIIKTKLTPSVKIGKTLAEITPEGKRAIPVAVDNIADIAGLIKPGDYVDVFALISPPPGRGQTPPKASSPNLVSLFQDIKILTVGTEFGQTPQTRATSAPAAKVVTLALSPQEAVLLSFVQEHGKIKLALRSSEDTKKEFIKPVDWDTLFEYLYPSREDGAEGSGPMVEIYRGLQKEVVPLSQKSEK